MYMKRFILSFAAALMLFGFSVGAALAQEIVVANGTGFTIQRLGLVDSNAGGNAQDLLGNEIGAAAKNVIGIAAGMLDGLDRTNLKGALMSRGTREIARLIAAMGGNEQSAYGLCHLGDYQATVFSPFSHNRRYGEAVIRHETFDKLAEGCYTVKALLDLGNRYDVELPICATVDAVLYHGAHPMEALDALFTRSLKKEF
ncbi:MAG: hypothetical protein EOM66_09970 [Clostridia bacterium]|nr:hypothetical protein [Clostridia bacterium]